MFTLKDKVSIVTGASSGIGGAIACLFAAHGSAVVLNARRAERLEEVAEVIRREGGRVRVVVGDVSRPEVHEAMIELRSSLPRASWGPASVCPEWQRMAHPRLR